MKQAAAESYGDMVKAVVDVEQKLIALGGEMHADAEALLLERGSKQTDLWGFNIYPDKLPAERLEFSSLINIRPSAGNRGMEIENEEIRKKFKQLLTNSS